MENGPLALPRTGRLVCARTTSGAASDFFSRSVQRDRNRADSPDELEGAEEERKVRKQRSDAGILAFFLIGSDVEDSCALNVESSDVKS